jgi:hypothetical protein
VNRLSITERLAVRLLTAQAVAFGIMAALLGIVANTLFLDEYGSKWLPVTYLFIAGAGIVVSGLVARSARGGQLMRIAITVLAGSVLVLVAAWLVAASGDGAWVSAPLLVLFPVLIQLGFVFIGGQAGRILDIAGIKAHFPRIVAGFPVGAVVGGVVAGPLLTLFGSSEHLLFAAAAAQAAFLCLLLLTGRWYAAELVPVAASPSPVNPVRQPLAQLLRSRFVLLIIAYQVFSAVGSQLADFLVFDRAADRYSDADELARFVARYTAVMNITSILFLAVLAGVLLRRFGLKLGLPANPAVLAVIALGMIVVTAIAGVGSLALLVAVATARIADIALTDGTTRTSINATYQVLPTDEQLAVQASVEGVGVPVAIGVSGVIILVLDAFPFAVEAMIVATTITCAIWTWIAVLLYREYGSALVRALSRRPTLDGEWAIDFHDPDEAAAMAFLASGDDREVRLGLEALTAMASPALGAELERLVDDPRPEIRLAALVRLAASGDPSARQQLRAEATADGASTDPAARVRAAQALGALETSDRAAGTYLLFDPDPRVRSAAIEAVRAGDLHAIGPVIAALGEPRTRALAAGAMERLGKSVAPAVTEVLDAAECPAPPLAGRVVRAARIAAPELAHEMLDRYVGHRDREFGCTVLERLVMPSPAPQSLAAELDRMLLDDAHHAARIAGAIVACAEITPQGSVLHRALSDELDLIRSRVAAGRLVRHGSDHLGAALLALTSDERQRSLAIESLEVTLQRSEAALVLPVLRPDLTATDRVALLPMPPGALPTDASGWLADLIADASGDWRSPWLRACALYTVVTASLVVPLDADQLRACDEPLIHELLTATASTSGLMPN